MELKLKNTRCNITGRFLKGHEPFNKGKKWSDYLPVETQKKLRKCLEIGRTGKRKYPVFYNIVLMLKDGKIIGVFKGSNKASEKTGIQARNIRLVCEGKRKRAGGYEWAYEKNYFNSVKKNQKIVKN